MPRIPVACTLTADDATGRVDEWRRLVRDHVVERQRDSSTARLRLRDADDSFVAAVDLARREKACCGFFDFRMDVEADAVWLVVGAPPDAQPLLDDLAGQPRA
ncbi:MAG: hypothetical protein ACRDZR_01135 [Acidimicrobiales bacterium]